MAKRKIKQEKKDEWMDNGSCFLFYVWTRCFCRRQVTDKDNNGMKKTWFCGMKLHQVKKIKGAGSRVAGASVDKEHEVAGVVDGTLEQARKSLAVLIPGDDLFFKRLLVMICSAVSR